MVRTEEEKRRREEVADFNLMRVNAYARCEKVRGSGK